MPAACEAPCQRGSLAGHGVLGPRSGRPLTLPGPAPGAVQVARVSLVSAGSALAGCAAGPGMREVALGSLDSESVVDSTVVY